MNTMQAGPEQRQREIADSFQTTPLTVDRLIVLVPTPGAEGVALARRIWALASPCELKVVLLCAVDDDASRESAARLRLATIASLIRDDHVEVETLVFTRQSWVGAVRRLYQPGDVVLCCVEQTIPTAANGRQPVWRVLQWVLNLPVYVLEGLYSETPSTQSPAAAAFARVITKSALAVIVAVFLYAALQIDMTTVGAAHTLLLLVAVVVELGLIAIWSSFA